MTSHTPDAKVEMVARLDKAIADHRAHLANLKAEYGVSSDERGVGIVMNFGDVIDLLAALEHSDAVMGEAMPSGATKRMAKTLGCKFVPHSTPPVQDDDARKIRQFINEGRGLTSDDLRRIADRLSRQAGGVK